MKAEGALWFLGGATLSKIFIKTGNAAGAVSQAIIAFGGLFFFISGWNAPVYIVSLKYVVPVGAAAAEANAYLRTLDPPLDDVVNFSAACPFYGIACFMIATLAGQLGVLSLPKNKLVSPFWGVTWFFLGAWTIGLFALWGPLIAGGFKDITEFADPPYVTAPIGHKFTHPFQVLGAAFLTIGALTFAVMNHSFNLFYTEPDNPKPLL